jgi:hypothetical protein
MPKEKYNLMLNNGSKRNTMKRSNPGQSARKRAAARAVGAEGPKLSTRNKKK